MLKGYYWLIGAKGQSKSYLIVKSKDTSYMLRITNYFNVALTACVVNCVVGTKNKSLLAGVLAIAQGILLVDWR